MTEENKAILKRINEYSEKELSDIDPQKVLVSAQLEKLKPILQEIADEKGISLTDMFILYMDIQSEASCKTEEKLRKELQDINQEDGGMPLLFR